MIKKGFSHIGIFFLYFLSLFPLPLLYVLADLMYYLVYYVVGYRKQVVHENLQYAFPEKGPKEIRSIERKYFRHLCSLMVEIVKMSTVSKSELLKRYTFKNLDRIQEYLKKGESLLGCSGHYGNWEWGMVALGLHLDTDKYVIYKPINNTVFSNWFLNLRSRFGNKLVAMRQTLRMVAGTRNQSTIFFFANDQTPTREETQYWLNFLNQSTPVLLGIEKIALQTNRPVFYLKTTVLKRGYYEVDCVPICLDPSKTTNHEITDRHFKVLEEMIIKAPQYWLWSHRRWKFKPVNA
ncbi:lysophospholipid acyltransferase family protein [Pedobacter sp. MC2016-14]|uniref:lysophospholipid acyltransferase family protein n=1 Tax=Pedobacter sp. MC2016-14 TaxID=2897327 RepID=UPI001E364C31|nr:lysophospholipid acyltransferase family protein [Pedobacter sp. MC2016-14]MCD0490007.1 lysophospholipid acyltransferase family protein [Pedobacter sp. MC2016-14]